MSIVYSSKVKSYFLTLREKSQGTVTIQTKTRLWTEHTDRCWASAAHSQPSGLKCLASPTPLALPPTEHATCRLQNGSTAQHCLCSGCTSTKASSASHCARPPLLSMASPVLSFHASSMSTVRETHGTRLSCQLEMQRDVSLVSLDHNHLCWHQEHTPKWLHFRDAGPFLINQHYLFSKERFHLSGACLLLTTADS